MKGEGDWNTNNNLKAILRLSIKDIMMSVFIEPAGGVPLKDFSAAADALESIKAVQKLVDRKPTNAK